MADKLRKLAGTLALIALVIVYSLTAMTIAAAKLPGTSGLVQLIYFAVAGLLWVLPAGLIIWWMAKPRKEGCS
jgi:uncharacterized membrane protein